jgi:RNA recognition motif-containing protein
MEAESLDFPNLPIIGCHERTIDMHIGTVGAGNQYKARRNSLILMSQYSFMNIRISNISLNTTDSELRKLFNPYGSVDTATVCRNTLNGRSLKYGQVTMPVPAHGRQAIASLDKTLMDGKMISVTELPADPY